jgi:CheY-like chemotaxis protein
MEMDKILLVEDNQALIDIYTITFTHQNFAIEVAHDGEECMQRVKTIKPDMILMDVMMPKMNGIQTLEKLKADEETKNIPVIMLSNIAESTEENRTKDLGAVSYLIKSHYLPMEILNIVKDALLKSRLQK